MGSPYFASIGYASPLTPVIQDRHPDLPGHRATSLHQDNHRLAGLPSCVTPSLAYYRIGSHAPPTTSPEGPERGSDGQHHRPGHGRTVTSTGISTRCPSTTPVGLALGPGSPWADKPGPGTLGQSAAEILTLHSLLMPAFSLPHPPPRFTPRLHRAQDAPLPNKPLQTHCHGFGGTLEPRYIVGAESLDQ